jgi:hypothetical protein
MAIQYLRVFVIFYMSPSDCPMDTEYAQFSKSAGHNIYLICTIMRIVPAARHQRQRTSLFMILGCLIVYAMFMVSLISPEVISVTTTIVDSHDDQPTKLQAQQTDTVNAVITTTSTRSQSSTNDEALRHDDQVTNEMHKPLEVIRTEPSESNASNPVLEETNIEAIPTISKETESETQIRQERPPLSISSHSPTNETSNVDQKITLKLDDDGIDPVAWSKLKIAVYMTSHLSEKHLLFLKRCWPYASGCLPLLQNSHLILYTSAEPPQDDLDRMQFKSVTVRRYVDPPSGSNESGISDKAVKQMGAKRAMVDPFLKENRWFNAFDWVIRLNPDVLIRRDTWIRQTMMNTSVDGIFVDYSTKSAKGVHSDFYAFRPSAANDEALIDNFHKRPTAETHLYSGFSDSILRKRVAWLPGARIHKEWARVIGKKSPVIHYHGYFKACPHYFNATYRNIY